MVQQLSLIFSKLHLFKGPFHVFEDQFSDVQIYNSLFYAFQGPNFRPPPSFLYQSPIAEKFNDMSLDWSSSARSYRPPNLSGPSILQYNLHNRGEGYEFNQPTSRDKATAYLTEKQRGMNHLMGKLTSLNSNNHSSSILYNQKPGPYSYIKSFSYYFYCNLIYVFWPRGFSIITRSRLLTNESLTAGPNCKVPTCPNVNDYHPLISLKEGPLGAQRAFPVTTPIETNGHLGLDERYLWHKANSSPLSHLHNDLNTGAPLESKNLNFGIHLDTPGKYQVVPRYCPKVPYKNQVLQNLSNEYPSCLLSILKCPFLLFCYFSLLAFGVNK